MPKGKLIEQIGKVNLDLTYYDEAMAPKADPIEDELLSIVQTFSNDQIPAVVEDRKSWPIFYHLSPLRQNIVEWLPMEKGKQDGVRVLEIGSSCGAITAALSRKADEVICIEPSKKRSLINAHRNADCDNVTIYVGELADVLPKITGQFDYIVLVGVLEHSTCYLKDEKPYEAMIKLLMGRLAVDGHMILAMANKYGMKYFAGCKEDSVGEYFGGIENYKDNNQVKTFSKSGLEKLFAACKVTKYSFYYPYPDYRFMSTLYSDAYLPGKGELTQNIVNFDQDRMVLFDERAAFEGAAEEGLFSMFANSFVVVIGDRFDAKYVKFSNDRALEYQVRTEICRDVNGLIDVRKYPITAQAVEHVKSMEVAYENLRERYEGSGLFVNQCRLYERGDQVWASFEYVAGITLAEMMDRCLEKDDIEGFHSLFRQYLDKIGYNQNYPVSDYDLIFANILVKGDKWTIIDYEWTFGKPQDVKETAFRAIYCYILEDEKRKKLNMDLILEELGITQKDAEYYKKQELEFQKFVTGQRKSMSEMRDLIGHRVIRPMDWVEKIEQAEDVLRFQVYEDRGQGYNEQDSYFVTEAFVTDGFVEVELVVTEQVMTLRLDPVMSSCVVKIKELTWNGQPINYHSKKYVITNGKLATDSFVFGTEDPNINIKVSELVRKPDNLLKAKLEVKLLPMEIAQDLISAVKKIL
ncbi:MAG: methyltransferase domain-containing protein [Lachnospiraceae bacterium]|nr:methyltransferase domain-containing protein [Lachnospiraceae bacterium]